MYNPGCCICGSSDTFLGAMTRDERKVCMKCKYKTRVIPEQWLYPSEDDYIKATVSDALGASLESVRVMEYGMEYDRRWFYDTKENRIGGGYYTGAFLPDQIVLIETGGVPFRVERTQDGDSIKASLQREDIDLPPIPLDRGNRQNLRLFVRVADPRMVRLPEINRHMIRINWHGTLLYEGLLLANMPGNAFQTYRDLLLFLIEEGEKIKTGTSTFPDV